VLDPQAARVVAHMFGADDEQVARDHLLSHLLAALSQAASEQVVFFGGTALGRAYLVSGRLSEDLDLIAVRDRHDVASKLELQLVRGLRREYPGLRWARTLTEVKDTQAAVLVAPADLVVRIQLLSADGLADWPTKVRNLEQRYSDAPPARLRVPTLPAFAAMKTAAWGERHAARDLYDLWALAGEGALNDEAAQLYARFGPTGSVPSSQIFSDAPSETSWHRELANQTRLTITAAQALEDVRAAWWTRTPVKL
jgi:predicted nucleotidyltransferase component of viral defense system